MKCDRQIYTNLRSALRTRRFLGKHGASLRVFRCKVCGRLHLESRLTALILSDSVEQPQTFSEKRKKEAA